MTELNKYFKYKCFKGLKHLGLAEKKEYIDRLNYEIEVITDMNFCGYLLIVQDFLNWARLNDILTGPARGSAGGSLACYVLGIITMDPIKHDLIFERFLNPARAPHIDYLSVLPSSIIGKKDQTFQELCLFLHKDRVEECEKSLDKELTLVLDTHKVPLLNAVKEGVKVKNTLSSALLYCLGLTDEKPIKPAKVTIGSMCDIDCDFAKSGRAKVLQYVIDKYGAECVAGIGTFNYQKAKSVVRNVTRALGYEYAVGDKLSNLLLAPVSGKTQSIETSLEKVPELKQMYESGGAEAEILKWSLRLEDTIYSVGSHASGYCIANKPIIEYLPTFNDKNGFPVSQWSMNEIEDVGIVKFDFLGIAALDKIQRCIALVKKRHGIDIDVYNLPLDNQKTFDLLKTGNIIGLFQLEGSSGMKDLILRIQPDTFEDIVAANAIFRPGPLDANAHDKYVNVKHGLQEAEYLVQAMKPILERTYGNMIYQEQLMEITRVCCGFSMAEADIARKGVAKKKEKVLKELKPKFMAGWEKNGHPLDKGEEMWESILSCSSYLFNRSHSVGYSLITYYTAYLKANYPAEFMCSIMSEDADNRDQMVQYFAECKQLGIRVLPPDINKSDELFTLDDDSNILFGLSPIKNVGNSADLIIKKRRKGYTSLADFCERLKGSKVNRLRIESLVRAGAFDTFADRATNLKTLSNVWDLTDDIKKYEKKFQTYTKKVKEWQDRENEILAGSKKKSLKRPKEPEQPRLTEVGLTSSLTEEEVLRDERSLVGFYMTAHPLDHYKECGMLSRDYIDIASINTLDHNSNVKSLMVVSKVEEITTRKKQKMAYLLLEDLTGSIEAVVFPRQFENFKHLFLAGTVVEVSASVEVNETNMQKTTKLVVRNMILPQKKKPSRAKPIEISLPINRLDKVVDVISKFKGDRYSVILHLHGVSEIKTSIKTKINGPKQHFLKEIEYATS